MKNANLMNTLAASCTANLTAEKNTIPAVYICSPYRPISTNPTFRANELIDNLKTAKHGCDTAVRLGYEPVAPHLYLTSILDDNDPTERELGMELGLRALEKYSALWIVGVRVSPGMSAEIKRAMEIGLPVLVLTADGAVTEDCLKDALDGVSTSAASEMTLADLLAVIKVHKSQMPPRVIAEYQNKSYSFSVYSDGRIYGTVDGHPVAFHITKCRDYTYPDEKRRKVPDDATPAYIGFEEFKAMLWYIRVALEAEDQCF